MNVKNDKQLVGSARGAVHRVGARRAAAPGSGVACLRDGGLMWMTMGWYSAKKPPVTRGPVGASCCWLSASSASSASRAVARFSSKRLRRTRMFLVG